MNNLKKILLSGLFIVTASCAWSYDKKLAGSYEKLFAPVKGAQAGKALNVLTVETFINNLKLHTPYVPVDIRTPAELGVFALTIPGNMQISVDQLFKVDNLNKIPVDKPVVLVCSSGIRSSSAAIALRHLGFSNIYILKGGFRELSTYLEPKEANQPATETLKQY